MKFVLSIETFYEVKSWFGSLSWIMVMDESSKMINPVWNCLKSVFSCNEGSTNELTNAYVQALNFTFIGVGERNDQNLRRQLNLLVNTFRLQHPSVTDRHQQKWSRPHPNEIFELMRNILNPCSTRSNWAARQNYYQQRFIYFYCRWIEKIE